MFGEWSPNVEIQGRDPDLTRITKVAYKSDPWARDQKESPKGHTNLTLEGNLENQESLLGGPGNENAQIGHR